MRRPKVTPSFVISLLALFVALSSGAYAATGGSFILGQANTATTKTSLTDKAGAPALQITNNSTKPGATPLLLQSDNTHPPLITSSQATATNLSADLLDGIDSAGFAQGANTQILTERKVMVPTNSATLFTIPGFGDVTATCYPTGAEVDFHNTSGVGIDVWTTLQGGILGQIVEPGGVQQIMGSFSSQQLGEGGTTSLGRGNDPGPRSAAFIHGFGLQSADGAPCGFQAQATVWHS